MPGYSPQPPGPPARSGGRRMLATCLRCRHHRRRSSPAPAAAVITVQARDTTAAAAGSVACTRDGHRRSAHTRTTGPACQPRRRTAKRASRAGSSRGNLTKSAQPRWQFFPQGSRSAILRCSRILNGQPRCSRPAASTRQASDALESNIAPGTTSVLAEAAHTTREGTPCSWRRHTDKFDPITGNADDIAVEASDADGRLVRLVWRRSGKDSAPWLLVRS